MLVGSVLLGGLAVLYNDEGNERWIVGCMNSRSKCKTIDRRPKIGFRFCSPLVPDRGRDRQCFCRLRTVVEPPCPLERVSLKHTYGTTSTRARNDAV